MAGLLVGEGGADGEAGGDSACSSAELQLVGVLRRGKCSGAAAATGREGRTGGARGRRSELGRVRFDPGQPWVQQLPGAADANCWCQTLPAGTSFEAAQVSLVSCAVPTHRGSNGSDLALSSRAHLPIEDILTCIYTCIVVLHSTRTCTLALCTVGTL